MVVVRLHADVKILYRHRTSKSHQRLVKSEEGREEGPIYKVGEQNEGVRLLQVQYEDGGYKGHALEESCVKNILSVLCRPGSPIFIGDTSNMPT